MQFHELRWNAGSHPYSMACARHRTTGDQLIITITEDGRYNLYGQSSNTHDRDDLTKLEVAVVLAGCEPDPTWDPADYQVETSDGPRPPIKWLRVAPRTVELPDFPKLPTGEWMLLVSPPPDPEELV